MIDFRRVSAVVRRLTQDAHSLQAASSRNRVTLRSPESSSRGC